MRSWGVTLLIIGVGSFILPLFGYQFVLINLFGENSQSIVGILAAVLGAALIIGGSAREQEAYID